MNPTVTYEVDYYMLDQEIIFFSSKTENVLNINFWKQ